jgi:LAO/AO transport system kinase
LSVAEPERARPERADVPAEPPGLAPAERRELGRRLSRLADADAAQVLALAGDAPPACAAWRIGLTGPPGAGKSSLAGRLALLRAARARIGVLAIDPSSPRSGGAILGDRIRMDDLPGIERLFVRSLASRSAADGLSQNIPELLGAMDAAGFDEVLLETVGVGQVEHAVRHQVDTLVLVLVPGAGDHVQAMKAGVMELADVLVVNKSDLPGADRLLADVARVVQLAAPSRDGWTPPVVATCVTDPASIAALSAQVDRHRAWRAGRDGASDRVAHRRRYRLRALLERQVADRVATLSPQALGAPLREQARQVLRGLLDDLDASHFGNP